MHVEGPRETLAQNLERCLVLSDQLRLSMVGIHIAQALNCLDEKKYNEFGNESRMD